FHFQAASFHPHLRSHRIHKLSARDGRTIFAAEIESDLQRPFLRVQKHGSSIVAARAGLNCRRMALAGFTGPGYR
ncbi:MAG: hypothetical protein ACREP1_09860, partial [Rhodanobacteraceae bacterium]